MTSSESKIFANLISKLNFYKLIPYPMDNCFTGRPVKLPAGPVTECAFARWRKVYHFLSGHNDVKASILCLILLRPLVS